jgi:hypothetical protein
MPDLQPAERPSAPNLMTPHSPSLATQLVVPQDEIRKMVLVHPSGRAGKEWMEACLRCLHETAEQSGGIESITTTRCA